MLLALATAVAGTTGAGAAFAATVVAIAATVIATTRATAARASLVATTSAIAAATHRVLRPGGAFLVYQFRARARDFLATHFRRIDNAFEWVNVPPCFLFWGWKD